MNISDRGNQGDQEYRVLGDTEKIKDIKKLDMLDNLDIPRVLDILGNLDNPKQDNDK